MAIVLFAARALAQPDDADQRGGTTYLGEQLAGIEGVAKARRLVKDARWDRAVETYQDTIDKFGDSLVAHELASGNTPASSAPAAAPALQRFVALRQVIVTDLMSGPPQLLDAYQKRYEATARHELQQALLPARRVQVAERYFATRAAARALNSRAESLLESAEFAAARRLFMQLAESHPDRTADGHLWRAKAALCDWFGGNTAEFESALESIDANAANVRVAWAGAPVTLSAFLSDAKRNSAGLPSAAATHAVPVLAGAPNQRAKLPDCAMPEARLWQYSDFRPACAVNMPADDVRDEQLDEAVRRSLGTGRHLSLIPSIANGRMYVCDRRNVWAIDLATPESTMWRFWTGAAAGDFNEADWSSEDEAAMLFTIAATPDWVYAPLDPPPPASTDDRHADSTVLVCLNATTGALRWQCDMQQLGNRFDEFRLDGAPLLLGERAYVVARQRKPFGFEACLLVCCDASSGRVLWRTHLGEAATGGYGFNRPTRTFPAIANGRVFVQSNLGTVAAVEADSGRLAWLWRYPTPSGESATNMPGGRSASEIRPWQYNAVIAWQNSVIASPLDSTELFVFDADDGRLSRRIGFADELAGADSVLGVHDGRLCAAGRWVACLDLTGAGRSWRRQLPDGVPYGRGALCGDGLLIPTDKALLRYALDGGAPGTFAWSWRRAGNIVVQPALLVAAGGGALSGLVEKEQALAGLRLRMTEHPDDPRPALAIADLQFETRDYAAGMKALDDVVLRASRASSLDPAVTARIFRRFIDAADLLAADRRADALRMLKLAGGFASDDEDHVRYRLKQADLQLTDGRPRDAVATYQELLTNRRLAGRTAPLARKSDKIVGAYARDAIDRLIETQGREVYAPIEAAATTALEAAAAAKNATELAQVATDYPNSAAALRALVQAAELRLAAHETAEAIRLAHRARQMPGGRDATGAARVLAQAANAGAANYSTEASRPRVTFPVAQAWSREFASSPALLEPQLERADTTWDGLMVHCNGRLEMLDAATGAPRWPQPLILRERPSLICQSASMAVVSTRHQTSGVRAQSGELMWTWGADGAAADQPEVDPESVPQWIAHAASATHVVALNSRNELFCIRQHDGKLAWRVAPESHKIGTRIVVDDRVVACVAWEDRQNTILLLDAVTGAPRRAMRIAAERPLLSVRFTADGSLLALSATSAHLLNLDGVCWNLAFDGRVLSPSICLSDDALFVSLDGLRITCVELSRGSIRWTSESLFPQAGDTVRTERVEDRLIVGMADQLCVISTTDAGVQWRRTLAGVDVFPPVVVGENVLAVMAEPPGDAAAGEPRPAQAAAEDAPQAQDKPPLPLVRMDIGNGRPRRILAEGGEGTRLSIERPEVTLVRDRTLLFRSGRNVSAYVGP